MHASFVDFLSLRVITNLFQELGGRVSTPHSLMIMLFLDQIRLLVWIVSRLFVLDAIRT